MWTSDTLGYLARDRQAELLRLAADIRLLGLAPQARRKRRIGDEVRGALQGFLWCFSVAAVLRRFTDPTSAHVAPGSARS